MSRGRLVFALISTQIVLFACGEPFSAVTADDEAGAPSSGEPDGSGAKSLGGRPGVLTRPGSGGEGAEPDVIENGGEPAVLAIAGAPGSAGAPDAGSSRCPELSGEKLVLVGSYCIDENEVTAAHYQAFVDSKPSLTEQPLECVGNTSFANGCKVTDPTKQPARCVDWCDAHAYCASVGKRLCGASEGAAPFDGPPDSLDDQWYAACSHAGEHAYPYGDEYDPSACWGAEHPPPGTLTVKSASGCEGGFDGVFDMSGGMAEWVDSCNGAKGMTDACQIRGGSSSGTIEQLRCDKHDATPRSTASSYIGFRCCAGAVQ